MDDRKFGPIVEAAGERMPVDDRAPDAEWAGRDGPRAPHRLSRCRQRFLGIDLMTRGDVLIPREETELLGREAIAILRALSLESPLREQRMIDMGCGSGNLACAAAVAVPRTRVWASDISEPCALLTRANVVHHSLQDWIQVTEGDLFAPLAARGLEGTMDMVVMNPPYIPSTSLESSHSSLLRNEPREAFDGGPYGISVFLRLLQEAPPFLRKGGHLLFEFGLGQAKIVQALVERTHLNVDARYVSDARGEARAAVLRV